MFAAHPCIANYGEWRDTARELLRRRVPPGQIVWSTSGDPQELLFESGPPPSTAAGPPLLIPRAFLKLAEVVARHSDSNRWSTLYRTAWRLTNGERHLLEIETDDDVTALNAMRRAVEKDIYRMRAFVRFRKVDTDEGPHFVAWYRPEHHTLDANGPFFVSRFGSMRWTILTPEQTLVWDLQKLQTGPGVPRHQAPQEDELEDLWRLYYRTIYNPARLNLTAMRAQLPVSRWADLPEARTIRELARESNGRVRQMAAAQSPSAAHWIPPAAELSVLGNAIHACRACNLCRLATQPVWGEGHPQARIMLVGEQPGDEEDRRGRPFIGPAGQVLDTALREAGLPRSEIYITNAVKAFRFEERGKRRIHQTPRSQDIATCRPWLLAEIEAVHPRVIVCLGATAAQSVLGRKVQIAAERGRLLPNASGTRIGISYHPSAILRSPDPASQKELLAALVSDLILAGQTAGEA
ncbi:MAG: UdgX family uracil-DNA binding protein [Bryobacteraceae bacterium]